MRVLGTYVSPSEGKSKTLPVNGAKQTWEEVSKPPRGVEKEYKM